MPAARIACPRCSKSLRADKPFGVGSRFRCPRCHAAFTARPEDVAVAADPPPPRSGGWLPLLVVVGAAFLLLAVAGLALTLYVLVRVARPAVAGNSEDKNDPATHEQGLPEWQPFNPVPPAGVAPSAQAWLPPEQREKINAAVERGVAYLLKTQTGGGSWSFNLQYETGLAAFPALTLLECGVPPDDPHVQQAAAFVRRTAPNLVARTTTYELALSILFLDRLNDPRDEALIRDMALRLIAGQTAAGGWTYGCGAPLSEEDQRNLLTILQTTRPRSSLELVAPPAGENRLDDLFTGRVGNAPLPSDGPTDDERKQARLMYDGLSPALKGIPALRPPNADEQMPLGDASDNSNTQFATLGLWAAGRHGVPMARSLALLARRFQVSQDARGGWAYNYFRHPNPSEAPGPAMTGAGLLGLAVGHGVTADLKGTNAAAEDPQVEKGMKAFGQFINVHGLQPPLERNYYFLWSVERVGMLYGRQAIADKEWYPWGAAELVGCQDADGAWRNGAYPGAVPEADTCFALLFLKRANLAKDLTTKVQFLTRVK